MRVWLCAGGFLSSAGLTINAGERRAITPELRRLPGGDYEVRVVLIESGSRQGKTLYFFEMVTAAFAVLLGSATAVALTVTTAGFGTVFGARYRPDVLIVPTDPLPPLIPLTFQITDVFALF